MIAECVEHHPQMGSMHTVVLAAVQNQDLALALKTGNCTTFSQM